MPGMTHRRVLPINGAAALLGLTPKANRVCRAAEARR